MDLSQLTPEQRKEVEEKLKNMSPEELAQLQAQQCIFCQIIAGKIPSKKVFEDENCIAVLDINPGAKGHVLLMPKAHISIMPQLEEDVGGHLMQVAREISRHQLKNLRASGSTIFVANGLAAGQRAQHFMLHVIPRKEGDNVLSYEKHIVDLDKRKALRELIASRMTQITDFVDKYSDGSSDTGEPSKKEVSDEKLDEAARDVEEIDTEEHNSEEHEEGDSESLDEDSDEDEGDDDSDDENDDGPEDDDNSEDDEDSDDDGEDSDDDDEDSEDEDNDDEDNSKDKSKHYPKPKRDVDLDDIANLFS